MAWSTQVQSQDHTAGQTLMRILASEPFRIIQYQAVSAATCRYLIECHNFLLAIYMAMRSVASAPPDQLLILHLSASEVCVLLNVLNRCYNLSTLCNCYLEYNWNTVWYTTAVSPHCLFHVAASVSSATDVQLEV